LSTQKAEAMNKPGSGFNSKFYNFLTWVFRRSAPILEEQCSDVRYDDNYGTAHATRDKRGWIIIQGSKKMEAGEKLVTVDTSVLIEGKSYKMDVWSQNVSGGPVYGPKSTPHVWVDDREDNKSICQFRTDEVNSFSMTVFYNIAGYFIS
jgi:hypothetical protein